MTTHGREPRPGGLAATLLALLLAVARAGGCSSWRPAAPAARPGAAVVVASFNFPESELLAEIYAQALRHAGVPVRLQSDLGTREMVLPALREGLVDVVPEYLGTSLEAVDPQAAVDRTDDAQVLAALRTALARLHLHVLAPAAASDQNALVITRSASQHWHVRTVSQLAALRRPLRLAAPSECPVRPYCLPGLRRVYGLRFARVLPVDDATQRITALTEGMVDVALAFTTDGRLASTGLVLLADDRALQPTERIVPVVSDRALHRYGPQISATLAAVSAHLDSPGLRFLNWRVEVAGKAPASEAAAWLRRHGLLARN